MTKNVFNRKDMINFAKYCKNLPKAFANTWNLMDEGEKEAHLDNLLEDWITINERTPKKEKKEIKHEFDFE